MAYVAEYDEADLSASVIDTIIKVFIIIGQFITLVVILFMWAWAKKKFR